MRLVWTQVCVNRFENAPGMRVSIAACHKMRRRSSLSMSKHIVSKQHGGSDDPDGLALACDRCNAYKGPNLSSIDPETRTLVALFHPRGDLWGDHFVIRDGQIVGLTTRGRATVRLLNMNAPRRVELRRESRWTPG